MKQIKTRIPRSLFAAILCIVTATGCSHKAGGDSDDAGDASAAKAEVSLTRVARGNIAATFSLSGTVGALPNQDVRVSALVAGRIATLNVAEGDAVQAGQVLATLDSRTYTDQLKQAEAAQQQAKANLDNAKLSNARNLDLFNRGIAARKDSEDARTQEAVATASLAQADAALELTRLQIERAEIRSPIGGTVVKRFASVGEQVDGTAAQPIVEVANLHEVEFLGNAAAVYLSKLHPGEHVDVTTAALPDQRFSGSVVAISPSVDPATGAGLVRIRVPNAGGLLRMGMFLNAEISIDAHVHALIVPAEAIYHNDEGEAVVFTVEKDAATAVPVKVGIETKEKVELLSGVKEGDTIIRTGAYGLGEKAQIQVKSEAKSDAPQGKPDTPEDKSDSDTSK